MAKAVKCSVIFQGSKLFWRTRNNVDITIVQHYEYGITEIIAYEPSINVEAKRIYLNSEILLKKLRGSKIDSKLSFAKQNDIAVSTELFDSVLHEAITDFVLSRLTISEFKNDDGCFEVSLLFQSCDGVSTSGRGAINELVCPKVAQLQPYETANHKLLAPGEVEAAFKALELEQHQLRVYCSEAAALQAGAQSPLSNKECARITDMIEVDAPNALDATIIIPTSCITEIYVENGVMDTIPPHIPLNVAWTSDACPIACAGVNVNDALDTHEAHLRGKLELSDRRVSYPRNHKLGISVTPRNSSRLLAGTATSQARAQCAAEDNQPTPKVSRRKLLKRSSSRNVQNNSNNTSKRSLRVATRSESRDIADFAADPSANPWASPEADYSTLGNGVSGGSARAGFINQVATGLSSLAASVSAKFKTPSVHNHVCDDVNDDIPNQPMIKQGLAESTVPTVAVSRLNSAEFMGEDDAPPEVGMKKQRSKGKRSSYFGAVLEKLIRADSEPENQVFTAEAPSQKLPAPSRSFSIKPCRRASWLPWNLFGTAAVVPIE